MAGMYGGLAPHLLWAVPSAAITLGVYEIVLSTLSVKPWYFPSIECGARLCRERSQAWKVSEAAIWPEFFSILSVIATPSCRSMAPWILQP